MKGLALFAILDLLQLYQKSYLIHSSQNQVKFKHVGITYLYIAEYLQHYVCPLDTIRLMGFEGIHGQPALLDISIPTKTSNLDIIKYKDIKEEK